MVVDVNLWTRICTQTALRKLALRPLLKSPFQCRAFCPYFHTCHTGANKGTTKLYTYFCPGFNKSSSIEWFSVSPPQHTETFKKAPRYKRPSKLKLYRIQLAHLDPCSFIWLVGVFYLPLIFTLDSFLRIEIL